MGAVFKKTATKPLPAGVKIIVRKGQRLAEWADAKRKRRTAPVTVGKDGTDRIVITARTYTAKYRDGAGVVQEVATGCRDESAARSVLTELEKRAEKVKGGILTPAEDRMVDHHETPLAEHFAAYVAHQGSKGLNRVRVNNTKARLERLAAECGFRRLADLSAAGLERWLVAQQADGMGAGTRNEYRQELIGFGNWCVRNRRLLNNPFAGVPKADAKADCRRKRRALTEDELLRLLTVARLRPLAECGRLSVRKAQDEVKGQRDTWSKTAITLEDLDGATARGRERLANNPGLVARLEALGRERALLYKALVLTGLRKGELASLTVGQLMLDADPAFLTLDAADEKNGQGNSLPLRADLAADLRDWLAEKDAAGDAPTVRFDRAGLPADAPLFTVPAGLVRILDRDLKAAGISKRDERGRTVDVHAMRTTFGTLLSKGGVAPRTAQAAMRHSTIDLTMNTYTDPKLLDVAGAMEALPALPLSAGTRRERIAAKATGTDDSGPCQFAPKFAPAIGKQGLLRSIADKNPADLQGEEKADPIAVSAYPVKHKGPLTTAVNGPSVVDRRRKQHEFHKYCCISTYDFESVPYLTRYLTILHISGGAFLWPIGEVPGGFFHLLRHPPFLLELATPPPVNYRGKLCVPLWPQPVEFG